SSAPKTKPSWTAIVSHALSPLDRDQRRRSSGSTADAENHVVIASAIATESSDSAVVRDMPPLRGGDRAVGRADPRPPRPRRLGELLEHRHGLVPADARVGDALTVGESRSIRELLTAFHQEALEHHADDAALARGQLLGDGSRDVSLTAEVLLAVAVAGVDHHAWRLRRLAQEREHALDVRAVVVRPGAAAAQDDVAVGIATGDNDPGETLLGHPRAGMRMRGRADRVDRHLDATAGAVLKADRHRQARRELAVHLALGGPRADRAPGHEIGGVLRRDRIEELAAGVQAERAEIEQQLPREVESLVERIAAVEWRVV